MITLSLILQMGGGTGGWTMGFIGPLLGLLVMAAIVWVLWTALRTGDSQTAPKTETDDALETLRKRYARGEIDEATFEERAQKLRKR